MNIIYQWNPWSYMHITSLELEKNLSKKVWDIVWKPDFKDVWEEIKDENVWVLAIENSYMWSIHTNLYNFLKYDYKIIGEYYLEINHCLCSKENDISKIKKIYSQSPALDQCYNYLKEKKIDSESYSDTSLAAKYVSETSEEWLWAICSEMAAKLNWLNILDRNIQDQDWNTTRFAVIVINDSWVSYRVKSNKISILFEAKNEPSSLYNCLWVFAKSNLNLTKIESMPSYKWKFKYMFWVDFEWNMWEKKVSEALKNLDNYTSFVKILGEY